MTEQSHIDLIEELAVAEGIKTEARRKWRERGRVPFKWRLPLMGAAKRAGKEIDPAIFDQFAAPQPQEAA